MQEDNDIELKTCNVCKRQLPATTEYFYTKKGQKSFCYRCKECKNKYKREWLAKNPDKQKRDREQAKLWDRTHKEAKSKRDSLRWLRLKDNEEFRKRKRIDRKRRELKKRSLESTFTSKDWELCLQHFNNKCAYCGEENQLVQDHFVPIVKGGAYTVDNIVPACILCNQRKNALDFCEWYPRQEFYTKDRYLKIIDYINKNAKQEAI
jgi:hypothetical protein